MAFFRPEYWSGWPFPSPGALPNPGIETVSPRVEQQVFLGVDLVVQRSRVAHRDLLIPAFGAYPLLALERIELGDRDVEFGERHAYGRVAHILVQVHRRTQTHADAREIGAPAD